MKTSHLRGGKNASEQGSDSLGQVEEVAMKKSSSFSESLTYTLALLDLSDSNRP